MDGDDRRGRARSFVLGGLVGASAALATARRSGVATRRRRREMTLQTPAGLAAFESAPCFRELLGETPPDDA
ncbi:MAG TPA: YtxH domain-containing protein [Gaiellaceae bacterium]|nr:YtxH domain-containing protein [Gaiellaceae bacterium]